MCFYSLLCKKHKFWRRFSKSRQVEPTETSQTCENNKDRGRFVKMSAGIILIFKLSLYVQDFQEKGEAVWPHITSAHATAWCCYATPAFAFKEVCPTLEGSSHSTWVLSPLRGPLAGCICGLMRRFLGALWSRPPSPSSSSTTGAFHVACFGLRSSQITFLMRPLSVRKHVNCTLYKLFPPPPRLAKVPRDSLREANSIQVSHQGY